MLRAIVIAAVVAGSVACSAPERRVEWGYRFDSAVAERAPVQLVASLQDGCEPGARELERWVVGRSAPAMERRSGEPTLAIALRAVDEGTGCRVYAAGCAVLGEGRTEIVLAATTGAPICPGDTLCSQLSCDPSGDAGTPRDAGDASTSDDGGIDGGTDGGTIDGGTDAGTDAGPPDSGPIDGGPPSACDVLRASGAVWSCDDFDGVRDPSVTLEVFGTGTAAFVTTMARSGTTAARLQVAAPMDLAMLRARGFPADASDVWLRAWVYFEPLPFRIDLSYIYAGDGNEGVASVLSDLRQVGLWLGPDGASAWNTYGPATVPTGWSCIEEHVQASASGLVELFADGTLMRSATGNTLSADGPYERLVLGFAKTTATSGAGTLYIDDIAVGPARLPCP